MKFIIGYLQNLNLYEIGASFLGSITAAITSLKQDRAASQKTDLIALFFGCICGVISSIYLSPWIAFIISAESFIGGVNFLCGLFAMNLAQTILDGLKSGEFKSAILSWLTKG